MLDPFRIMRRHRSFVAAVIDELNYLVEQYGEDAREAAKARLRSPDLPPPRKRVMAEVVKRLKR